MMNKRTKMVFKSTKVLILLILLGSSICLATSNKKKCQSDGTNNEGIIVSDKTKGCNNVPRSSENNVPKSSENKIEDYMDSPFGITAPYIGKDASVHIRDLEIHWVRIGTINNFAWGSIEEIGWKRADIDISRAMRDKMHMIIPVNSYNKKDTKVEVRHLSHPLIRFTPTDMKSYDSFFEKYIKRYKDKAKYFQVGNEMNVFWKDKQVALVEFLRYHYKKIKYHCPDCKIVFGGLSSAPEDYYPDKVYKGRLCIQDFLSLLSRSRQYPGEQFFDVFDFHWYGQKHDYKSLKKKENGELINLSDFINDIKKDFKKFKINAEIFICETGTHSNEIIDERIPFPPQTEKEQAAELLKRFVYPISLGIKKVFWTSLTEWFGYGRRKNGYFDNMGLINNTHNKIDNRDWKKLAYYTYKQMVEKLEGSDWENIETIKNGSDNVYGYKFYKKGTKVAVYVMWWDWFDEKVYKKGDIKNVDIKVDSDKVLVTSTVPKSEDGSKIKDKPIFATKVIKVKSGIASIPLSVAPVYIETDLNDYL